MVVEVEEVGCHLRSLDLDHRAIAHKTRIGEEGNHPSLLRLQLRFQIIKQNLLRPAGPVVSSSRNTFYPEKDQFVRCESFVESFFACSQDKSSPLISTYGLLVRMQQRCASKLDLSWVYVRVFISIFLAIRAKSQDRGRLSSQVPHALSFPLNWTPRSTLEHYSGELRRLPCRLAVCPFGVSPLLKYTGYLVSCN